MEELTSRRFIDGADVDFEKKRLVAVRSGLGSRSLRAWQPLARGLAAARSGLGSRSLGAW
jgi:hypothetical protein